MTSKGSSKMRAIALILLLPLLGACIGEEKYDRNEWGGWTSKGKCNTREIVIRNSGKNVRVDSECRSLQGRWFSAYDAREISNGAALEIDHIVPVKEAWLSGGKNWSPKQKNIFYNDLDNLIAVSKESNRAKSDSDPAKWTPADKSYTCNFIRSWVKVKKKYSLIQDSVESAAIANLRCKGV
jgi:hypothetical protein